MKIDASLNPSTSAVSFRIAQEADLIALVDLIVDDELGKNREQKNSGEPPAPEYIQAFHEIMADSQNDLLVGEQNGEVIACLQLTYIPNLTLKGSKRALIEGVRVASKLRGQGVGNLLMAEALRRARERKCKVVQLTSNKARGDAIRFYERLGFVSSHQGMKLVLE